MTESTILPDYITAAKSNQLNADDLTGAPRPRCVITEVIIKGTPDQPLWIVLDGDRAKPWKPCKGMVRVMKAAWSKDTAYWIQQAVGLWNDPDVMWAGVKTGGIRINAMTGIKEDTTFAVTEKKGSKKSMRVRRIDGPSPQPPEAKAAEKKAEISADEKRMKSEKWMGSVILAISNAGTDLEAIEALEKKHADSLVRLHEAYPDIALIINDAFVTARNEANKE